MLEKRDVLLMSFLFHVNSPLPSPHASETVTTYVVPRISLTLVPPERAEKFHTTLA